MTTTLEAPVEPEATQRVTQVEDLPDPVRADIIARRQAGETLAELKAHFAHVDPAVIREVLPAGNARERKARDSKPKAPKAKPEAKAPKPAPEPRYATDLGDLPERVVAARQVMGRNQLAEALGVTGSACWRFEHGRIKPDEVKPLQDGLAAVERRIAEGEFVKPEPQPKATGSSKADLIYRQEVAAELLRTARGDKSIGKAALVDSVLAVLEPSQPSKS